MSQQELNLVEFATSEVAQPGAGAPEIVRGQLLDAGVPGRRLHHVPDDFRRHALTPHATGLVGRAKRSPLCEAGGRRPVVKAGLDPVRHRDGPDVAGLAQQISDDPMLFALLDRLEFQCQHLAASQSTAEQHGHHRVVAQSAKGEWGLRAEEAPALFRRQPVS
jgi:hypothetical protein